MGGRKTSGTNDSQLRLLRETKLREYRRDYTGAVKAFVRKHAWVPAAQNRLQQAKHERGAEFLKYFTLCAEKAIDVHLLGIENLVDFDGRGYPEVVFCEYHAEQYELIARTLGRTKNGYLARFEDLVLDEASQESQDFYSELPFDIYNLDFTSVCFPKTEPPFSNTLDAIVTLIKKLGEEALFRQGFDIFLTFRAQRSADNNEAIRSLKDNVRVNRREFDWFDKALELNYGPSVGKLVNNRYHEFLLVALPKLLAWYAQDFGFGVECPHRLCYARPDPQHPHFHIISFVLSFDWVGVSTSSERSVRQPSPKQAFTTAAYVKMVRHVIEQKPTNVDTAKFPRRKYAQEVQELLDLVEDW